MDLNRTIFVNLRSSEEPILRVRILNLSNVTAVLIDEIQHVWMSNCLIGFSSYDLLVQNANGG